MINNFAALSDFHFIRPWWLLSILPMLILFVVLRNQQSLTRQWRPYMSEKIIKQLTINAERNSFVSPRNLFVIFAFISTLIMAGPTWQREPSPLFEDNSELIVVLDVSETMNNGDLQPSRLVRAKQKIVELIKRRGDAKTALVVYGGSAHVAMPVTKDSTLAGYFIDALDSQLLPQQTIMPEAFIDPVLKLLDNSKAPSTVLVLTDKTEQSAIEQLERKFEGVEHQLLVWAIGEHAQSGAETELGNQGLTQSDLQQLQQLAQAGHGQMIPFTHNSDDLNQIYSLIRNNLFAAQDAEQPWSDAGYWLLFLLLPIQLMWFRQGWTLKW